MMTWAQRQPARPLPGAGKHTGTSPPHRSPTTSHLPRPRATQAAEGEESLCLSTALDPGTAKVFTADSPFYDWLPFSLPCFGKLCLPSEHYPGSNHLFSHQH